MNSVPAIQLIVSFFPYPLLRLLPQAGAGQRERLLYMVYNTRYLFQALGGQFPD